MSRRSRRWLRGVVRHLDQAEEKAFGFAGNTRDAKHEEEATDIGDEIYLLKERAKQLRDDASRREAKT